MYVAGQYPQADTTPKPIHRRQRNAHQHPPPLKRRHCREEGVEVVSVEQESAENYD